jgi:alanine racemase
VDTSQFYRDTWVEINLDHIAYNVKEALQLLPSTTDLFAVVKANAYGHGDVQVANTAIKAGAKGLAVAFLDEALKLRNAGIEVPILVLGASRPEDAKLAADHRISLTVFQEEWLERAEPFLNGSSLNVHMKVDTGMGRIGVRTEKELKALEKRIMRSSAFRLEGIFTHFATADEVDTDYFRKQFEKFQVMVQLLEQKPKYIHCANSAATLRFKETSHAFNLVRYGISMYGLSPSADIQSLLPFELKPALSLHTKIVHVKKVKKGERISYGGVYEAKEDEWIATLPIGYADGWIRKLQGQEVLVGGKRAPIVGRICMDQCMIRLDEEVPVGTEVVLIGKQGRDEITMDEIAAKLETIHYEIGCMISHRVPRVYIESGKIVDVSNPLLSSHRKM